MKAVKYFIIILLVGGLSVYVLYFTTYVAPWDRLCAIQTTLDLGGLDPIPVDGENIEIKKFGGLFTRQFKIQFKADKLQIDQWVKCSKRLKDNLPQKIGEKKVYFIHPGEQKSFGGKVEIENDEVLIDMSWS